MCRRGLPDYHIYAHLPNRCSLEKKTIDRLNGKDSVEIVANFEFESHLLNTDNICANQVTSWALCSLAIFLAKGLGYAPLSFIRFPPLLRPYDISWLHSGRPEDNHHKAHCNS